MKSRLMMFLIPLFAFLIMPNIVNAASLKISVSCDDVIIGDETSCRVLGNATGNISAIHGEYSISGGTASFQSFALGSGWSGEGADGTFDLYTEKNKSGSFSLGTFKLKGVSVGKATISIKNVIAADENYNDIGAIAAVASSFYVKAKPTTAPTTKKPITNTTKKTTTTKYNTTTPNTTNTTALHTTTTTQVPLRLTSVTVDDFDVKYENGAYYVTVNPDTKEVVVNATAVNGITIIGTGKRNLAVGKNTVDLVLKNNFGQTNTIQVVITRPEGSGIYDTKLKNLKVVDYPFAFNPDTKEYTITIPSNVSEIYVIANSYNEDVIINGGGLQTLDDGENTIYVKVSYGDLATTEYVIHVKRSYTMLIMWIAIGILGITLIILLIYSRINKKNAINKVIAEKNKIIAEGNRIQNESKNMAVQFNGESVVGIGKSPVIPTKVVESQEPIDINILANQATSNQQVKMVSTAPQAQVKVIKKTIVPQQTQVKTVNTVVSSVNGTYNSDNQQS